MGVTPPKNDLLCAWRPVDADLSVPDLGMVVEACSIELKLKRWLPRHASVDPSIDKNIGRLTAQRSGGRLRVMD